MTDATTQPQNPPSDWSSVTFDLVVNGTTEFANQAGKTAQDVIYQSLKTAGSVAETLAGGHAYVAVGTLRVAGPLDTVIRVTVAVDGGYGSPDNVAKTLFQTAVGFGVGAGAGWLTAQTVAGKNPWAIGGATVLGTTGGAIAAGDLWDSSISDTPVGEWSKDTVAGLFDLHARVVSSPVADVTSPNVQAANNVVTTGTNSVQIDNAAQNKSTTVTATPGQTNSLTKTETVNGITTTQQYPPVKTTDQYRDLQVEFNTTSWKVGSNEVTVDLIAAATGNQLWQIQAANPTRNLSDLKTGDVVNLPTVQNGIVGFNDNIGMFNTYNMQTGQLLPKADNNVDLNALLNLENQYSQLFDQNLLDGSFYDHFTDFTSNYLVTANGTSINWNTVTGPGINLTPIGAFYESVTPTTDTAPSIADKTPVLLGSNNIGLTAAQLNQRDGNHDGKLSGTELNNLNLWADLNQNGALDSGELTTPTQANLSELPSTDYSLYTQGNSRISSPLTTAPVKGSETASQPGEPGRVYAIPTVPASNYNTLRSTDNTYAYRLVPNGIVYFATWKTTQIKVNSKNTTTLIGTNGNDNFDSSYFSGTLITHISSSKLINFLGGDGHDLVGGSIRNDNIWGGTGNDTLLGYAGDDKLYGEEGDDQLQGQDGADTLDGGIGLDTLFGGAGDDILNGGEDNDDLFGEAGDDLTRGDVGNDVLWGSDTLLCFTVSPKKGLRKHIAKNRMPWCLPTVNETEWRVAA